MERRTRLVRHEVQVMDEIKKEVAMPDEPVNNCYYQLAKDLNKLFGHDMLLLYLSILLSRHQPLNNFYKLLHH